MEGYWKAYVELNNKTLDEAREIFIELATQSECVVWYYHPRGKQNKGPHFHALLKDTKGIDDTYRNRLKKAFGVKGGQLGVSNNYAKGTKMTGVTIDKYVTYMSKGEYEPFYNKGFDENYLNEKKLEWKEVEKQPVLGDVIVNIIGQGKANRITQVSIARMALAKYNDDYVSADSYDEDGNLIVKKKKLVKIIADLCKEYNMTRNYRTVANIGQDVWCSLAYGEWERKILSMI